MTRQDGDAGASGTPAHPAAPGAGDPRLTWRATGLSATVADVSRTRREARDVLAAWGVGQGADDVLLLLDELAANAVRHARSPFDVTLTLGPDAVLCAVTDRDPRAPSLRPHSSEALDGRGLLMVDELARRWGVDRHDGGKTVWFEVSCR
jgi:anti-sigma regulatory factor (Ser/Thr protein kinase)